VWPRLVLSIGNRLVKIAPNKWHFWYLRGIDIAKSECYRICVPEKEHNVTQPRATKGSLPRLNATASIATVSARGVLLLLLVLVLHKPTLAQTIISASHSLITQAVDETKLTVLHGNTHPLARPELDQGAAPSSLPMQRMLLVLTRSAEQEAALQTLLQEQQDQSSPSFHKWLTPGEFGQQFGPSGQDVQTVAAWLAAHGFQVTSVSNGRNVIEFSGTAAQVQEAFHTTIHSYIVNGGQYWANDSDPQIPSALAAVIVGVDSLDSFPRKPMHHLGSMSTKPAPSAQANETKPLLTSQCGTNPNTGAPLYCNAVTPYDFATIYNVLPLWNATPPIDGTGQAIAIVGRSNINVQDVTDFRGIFGLPPNPPQIILDGPDPGIVQGDETEADLDVEWAGTVARSATVKLVVSQSTETTDGVDLSALYIVDNNVAPIMSESFLGCELDLGTAGNQFYKNLWEQAAAQGISVFVSSGDQGSAGCDFFQGNPPQPARSGLQVNGLASTPYNVAVGGTDFSDFSNPLLYWNTTNNPTTQESAKGYIPETTWNDTCTNAVFGTVGFSTNQETNCNNPQLSGTVRAIGGSGGKSNCTTPAGSTASSCAGGYTKPPWQTGAGVPGDGKRDLPDVSLFAGAGFIGNSYAICEADLQGPCSSSNFVNIGGTSASSPAFAGLLALVDQKMASRQGNPNFILYKLAAQQPASTCNSTTGPAANCAFNDVTSGTIAMPCATGTLNCTTSNSGDQYGILSGYNAATGYDLATGLGSVNANNMVSSWSSVKFTASSTTLTLNGGSAVNVTHGAPVNVSVSVSPTSPQPTGDVSLIATQGANTTDVDTLTLSNGTASGSTNMLPGGASYSVQAHYAGDATYGGSDSNAVTVTVTPESSKTNLSIVTFDPTSGQVTNSNATTFPYGSPYILRADVTNGSGTDCFTPGSTTLTYGCPTGTVSLTDNGSSLNGGTFALNSQGFTEDQSIQFTGGSHTVGASYSGDTSYNASTTTDTVTVTPAPTTTIINPPVFAPFPADTIGQPTALTVVTNSSSSGAAPGGSYTLFDGTTPLPLTVLSSYPVAGSPTSGAHMQAVIQTAISAPAGTHDLTVQYSGDSNYAPSTSGPVAVDVRYPITSSITATPGTVIYGYGTSVTLVATVDTTNLASNAALKPTGSFTFYSGSPINNPVTVNVIQDPSGNWELQASMTFTPQYSESVGVQYSGDSNYQPTYGGPNVFVNVVTPDFAVSSPPLTITAGQTSSSTLTITPLTNDTSTVQLSCPQSNLPGGIPNFPGATCSISPTSVTLTNGAAATATLTITTTAPSSSTSAHTPPGDWSPRTFSPISRNTWWMLSSIAGLLAVLTFVVPGKRRSASAACGLGLACILSFAIGCGGGAAASTGGGGGGGPVPTTTVLSTARTKVAQSAGLTLSASVTSSKAVTGAVNFSTPNCFDTFPVTVANGAAQITLTNPTFIQIGTCTWFAAYGGDSNNLGSQSGSLNVAITGTATFQLSGTTAGTVHWLSVSVNFQ